MVKKKTEHKMTFHEESICANCKRPVGECKFMMKAIPYQGSVWKQVLPPCRNKFAIYIMLPCPMEMK